MQNFQTHKNKIKNKIKNSSWHVYLNIFNHNVGGPLASIVPFTKLFYVVCSSFYYQHGQHEEGVTNIESFLGMK
jgi:hypothetical protein